MRDILKIDNLKIINKKTKIEVIDNFSMRISPGDIIALKGRNGSGKSTIIKSILGDTPREFSISGQIEHSSGLSIKNKSKYSDIMNFRRGIGYLPQMDDYRGYKNLTIKDIFLDSIISYKKDKINLSEILEELEKFEFDNGEKKFNLSLNPSKLSGGQQRIISIIANVFCRPNADFYILDEPLNNLDNRNIPFVINLIKEYSIRFPLSAFLIVTHNEQFDFINKVIEI